MEFKFIRDLVGACIKLCTQFPSHQAWHTEALQLMLITKSCLIDLNAICLKKKVSKSGIILSSTTQIQTHIHKHIFTYIYMDTVLLQIMTQAFISFQQLLTLATKQDKTTI